MTEQPIKPVFVFLPCADINRPGMGGILIIPDIPKPGRSGLTGDQAAFVDEIVRHLMELANSGADMECTIAGWDEDKPANAADIDDDNVTKAWAAVYMTLAVSFNAGKTGARLH
jgi:hypothetical protein